jgi:hypothetical protein
MEESHVVGGDGGVEVGRAEFFSEDDALVGEEFEGIGLEGGEGKVEREGGKVERRGGGEEKGAQDGSSEGRKREEGGAVGRKGKRELSWEEGGKRGRRGSKRRREEGEEKRTKVAAGTFLVISNK